MKALISAQVGASLLLVSLAASQTAPAPQMPSVDLPPALGRVLRDYEKNWKAGDAAGLAELFAEDGFVLSGEKPPIRGRAAIKEGYATARGDLRLRALAFQIEGSTGFIIGGFRYGETQTDMGKFTLTLKKASDGRWLIFSDMDNANSRPRG